MHMGLAAAVCGGVALCSIALAGSPTVAFWTTAGSCPLYGDRVMPGSGRFTTFTFGSGLTIRVSGSDVGGTDATFTGIQQTVFGEYGSYEIVDVWRRSTTRETSVRLQDAMGNVLLTVYFARGTMDWYLQDSSLSLGWGMFLTSDRAAPPRVERGPLLDGVLPPGTMPSVVYRMVGTGFGVPFDNAGILEFKRGKTESAGTADFVYACRADFNNDAVVDDSDFTGFVLAYAAMACQRGDPCRADFNNDGVVDDSDFAAFAVAYDRLLCD